MNNQISLLQEDGTVIKRWKVRIRMTFENASWITIPERWQLCLTEGDNIVWNDTTSQPLRKVGDEVYVVSSWLPTVLGAYEPMFKPVGDFDENGNILNKNTSDGVIPNFKEQRTYVDFDQSDNPGLPNL